MIFFKHSSIFHLEEDIIYTGVCIPFIGTDSLICDWEEHNANHKNAVAIAWDDCVSKKIEGHVPLTGAKLLPSFFSLQIITFV